MAGRPRSPELDEALLRATRALLAERGYAATTVDAVAARAGVPKSALYRRWRSKAELVFAAAVHGAHLEVADTGSLRGDLADLVARVVRALGGPVARAALPGLLADLAAAPAVRARFDAEVIGAQRALVAQVLRRAADRGEPAAPADAEALHAQILGTVFAWTVLLDRPVPADLPDHLAAALSAGLTRPEEPCSTS